MKRIKELLEIIALTVGLIIGLMALWDTIPTAHDLQAEILVAPVQPRLGQPTDQKRFSELLKKFIINHKSIKSLIQDPKKREEFGAEIEGQIGLGLVIKNFEDHQTSHLVFSKVKNTGTKTLAEVEMRFSSFISSDLVIIKRLGVKDKIIKKPEFSSSIGQLVSLGDIRPGEDVDVFLWGSNSVILPSSVNLTHRDGVGEIYYYAPVPKMIYYENGFWISFKRAALFVLGLAIFLLGIRALGRVVKSIRSQLKRATNGSAKKSVPADRPADGR